VTEDSQVRSTLLGCSIDRVDMAQAVLRCRSFIADGRAHRHVSVNAAKIVAAQEDERLREVIDTAELVTADGQSVVWASRLLGEPLPVRVAGIDLMHELLAAAASDGYRIFILGATETVLQRALARLRHQYPQIQIVGFHHGYFNEAEEHAIVGQIKAARPDMLFVAMSSPRKEFWAAEHAAELGVPLVIGVGGSVEILAGTRRRAPKWIQRIGLEWLFRLAQEPRRLARRYVSGNWRFINLVVIELLRTKSRSGTQRR
jgi:N-acetylglucosaminyldiphosphoundecaprenol N-acetyl-beta-D-mannosaminyltransferase